MKKLLNSVFKIVGVCNNIPVYEEEYPIVPDGPGYRPNKPSSILFISVILNQSLPIAQG